MKILITGGGGFVGSHVAEYYALRGEEVVIMDNLSRAEILGSGSKYSGYNWDYLEKYDNISRMKGDIKDAEALEKVAKDVDAIIHTAAQVAVTTSVADPRTDFEINALGTFNVLEAARKSKNSPAVLYCSTNKVYGDNVNKIPVVEGEKRYSFGDARYIEGIPEDFPTDLCEHTPYGASKFAADVYAQDYGKRGEVDTGIFRMSCISKDSEVSTPGGNIRIEDIKGERVNINCFSKNPGDVEAVETTGSFRTSPEGKKLFEIRTKGGYTIKATGDHKFFTPAGYLPLDNICYGSLVAVNPELYYQRKKYYKKLPDKIIIPKDKFADYIRKYGRTEKSNEKYVNKLSTRGLLPLSYNNKHIYTIAKLVGYLTGDGTLYHRIKKDGKSYTEIQVYALPKEIQEIKNAFKSLGFKPGKTRYSDSKSELSSGHVIEGRSHKFSVTQTDAFAFFEFLGVPVGNKAKKEFEVPLWIRNGPKDVQDEYLRGLFGAELSCPSMYKREGGKTDLQPLQFSQSKNEELHQNAELFRQQIVNMLEERGVEVRTRESRFFYRKGGDKSVCFYILIKPSKSNLLKFARIGYGFNKERNIKLYRLVEFLKTGMVYSYYDEWERESTHGLGDSSLIWDRVTYKEELPMEEIYDITVPHHHNFFANGFLVHNCIYGTRQFGSEDQGWIAHFTISTITNKPITIYGDGKQVRDVLYVTDLVKAYDAFLKRRDKCSGEVYNIGGGSKFTLSLLELLELLERETGKRSPTSYEGWRPSDQRVYISDIRKAKKELGWEPEIDPEKGVTKLIEWVRDNEGLF